MEKLLFGIVVTLLVILLIVAPFIYNRLNHLAPFKKMKRKEMDQCYYTEDQITKNINKK